VCVHVSEWSCFDNCFHSLNWLPSNINIDVNLLTKGSDLLTYQENITIFKHAFKYIKDSKDLQLSTILPYKVMFGL
jgi:hypothetical protein